MPSSIARFRERWIHERWNHAKSALPKAMLIAGGFAITFAAVVPVAPVAAHPHERDPKITLNAFLIGLGCVESGGRYSARNAHSGAYGRYQIMPFNWPNWAGRYIGDRRAAQTPANQEAVARAKIRDLYGWLGYWRKTAHWWLTGSKEMDPKKWSKFSTRYVNNVMAIAYRYLTPKGRTRIPRGCLAPFATNVDARFTTVNLNVRRAPGTENRRFAVAPRGTRLNVYDVGKDRRGRRWFKVQLPDKRIGWVASWYTRAA